jgi:hypothetical protein
MPSQYRKFFSLGGHDLLHQQQHQSIQLHIGTAGLSIARTLTNSGSSDATAANDDTAAGDSTSGDAAVAAACGNDDSQSGESSDSDTSDVEV